MYLPQDLLPEILSWLDVGSLLRFKTVCKSWCLLIEDRRFIRNHMNKSREEWVFHRIIDDSCDRYEFIDSYFRLILEYNCWRYCSRLRNPSTGKILELPVSDHYLPRDMKICHINSSDELKLVVPWQYESSVYLEKEAFLVLKVGTDTTWRMIDIPFLRFIYVEIESTAMVGEVYFMSYFIGTKEPHLELICLEMGNEQISRIQIPNCLSRGGSYSRVDPIAWGDSVALVSVIEDEQQIHIWVLENYKKERWAEKKIIVLLKVLNPQSIESIFIQKFEDNGQLIALDYTNFLWLDVSSGEIKRRYLAPEGQAFAYYHVPSLQHPKGH